MEPLYLEVHPTPSTTPSPPHIQDYIKWKEADICVYIYFMSIENCF